MKEMVWVQCKCCGSLHSVKQNNVSMSDDDLHTDPIYCPKCRGGTKHLLIGQDKEDVYWLGDNTLDERYYKYNTK